MKLNLLIYGIPFQIECSDSTLLKKLRLDFSSFLDSQTKNTIPPALIHVEITPSIPGVIPELTANRLSNNSVTFETSTHQYNDYYGDVLVIEEKKTGTTRIYGTSLDRIHEVLYLYLLSKSGKRLELQGLHKIHAMGIASKNTAILVMMPMKGGKSTLLWNILERNPDYQLLSDDSPLISRSGKALAFPLRLGFETLSEKMKEKIPEEFLYEIKRKHYGTKHLISAAYFQNRIAKNEFKKLILITGKRTLKPEPEIYRISKPALFLELLKHFVIGMGLPMILEHFFQAGLRDLGRRIFILSSRVLSAFSLLCRGEPYEILLSPSIKRNAALLDEFLQGKVK